MRNIDFLPESFRQTRHRRRMRCRRLWLATAGLCVLASWFAIDEVRVRRARAEHNYLVRQNDLVQASLAHLAALQGEQTALLDRYDLIQDLQPPVSCVGTLFRVAELLPENVSLRQLQMTCGTAANATPDSAAPAGAAPAAPKPVRVVFTGLAASQIDIAVLVGQFSSCRDFAHVRLEYSQAVATEAGQIHEFRVTFDIPAGTADRPASSPAQAARPGERQTAEGA